MIAGLPASTPAAVRGRDPRRPAGIFCVVAAWLLSCAGVAPAGAHHSFAAGYDNTRAVDLWGTIRESRWASPHIRLVLDVRGRQGEPVQWDFELASPANLVARGLLKADLEPGGRVRIQGYRARGEASAGYAVILVLSDGRAFRTGSVDCPQGGNDLIIGELQQTFRGAGAR